MFKDIFTDEFKMDQALTDLVIPAVDMSDNNKSYLFRKHGLNMKPSSDTFFDAMMATTSSPTFFSPYECKDKLFVDGGVTLNNPA